MDAIKNGRYRNNKREAKQEWNGRKSQRKKTYLVENAREQRVRELDKRETIHNTQKENRSKMGKKPEREQKPK